MPEPSWRLVFASPAGPGIRLHGVCLVVPGRVGGRGGVLAGRDGQAGAVTGGVEVGFHERIGGPEERFVDEPADFDGKAGEEG